MSLNTLETAYVNGDVIDASHINELTLALLGQFVGRDSNGVPTPLQSLGTLAIPWANIYATGIILNGLALDVSQVTAKPNRVVSGQTRSLSSMPDFLRANGAALEFDILGATIDLVLSINNTAVSISSDINKTGIVAAPSTNNTCLVNDTDMTNDLYAGEYHAQIPEIVIDTVGTEISSRVGQIAAFQTATGEIFQALIKDATTLTEVFRGYYFDDSGDPLARGNLSNNDTLTLLNIGWVFVEDNGTTVDVSYTTPSYTYEAPSSPSTGDYWFDTSNQVWKRYSGVSWDIINRILIGQVVSDDTNTIASRSLDFFNSFSELNNIDVEVDTTEVIKTRMIENKVNVYGTEIVTNLNGHTWNITTDLESPQTEASDTYYYLYLSDENQEIMSSTKPYIRKDLKGYYHPHHSWRCVGVTRNNSSNDLESAYSNPFNKDVDIAVTFSGWRSANQTTGSFINIDSIDIDSHGIKRSSIFKIPPFLGGKYLIGFFAQVNGNATMYINKNGSNYKTITHIRSTLEESGTQTIELREDDEVGIVPSVSTTFSGGPQTGASAAQFSMNRIGQ